jgi:hypothetical protein
VAGQEGGRWTCPTEEEEGGGEGRRKREEEEGVEIDESCRQWVSTLREDIVKRLQFKRRSTLKHKSSPVHLELGVTWRGGGDCVCRYVPVLEQEL